MFIRKKKYLEVEREFNRMSERMECKLRQLDVIMKANNSLKRELAKVESENARLERENKQLADKLAPKSCDGCIHTDNYRKCASCARYPKIKDKYEVC